MGTACGDSHEDGSLLQQTFGLHGALDGRTGVHAGAPGVDVFPFSRLHPNVLVPVPAGEEAGVGD